jgi:hypothetical protein
MKQLETLIAFWLLAGTFAICAGCGGHVENPTISRIAAASSAGDTAEDDDHALIDRGDASGDRDSFGVTYSKMSANAQTIGAFGPAFAWPIIPIHMALLQDGRVLSYGTDEFGNQGAALRYSIWDPQKGTGPNAHLLLNNSTATDTFCAAQVQLPATGEILIAGGDSTVNGQRNYSNSDLNAFNPATNALVKQNRPMAYKRWYASMVTLASGATVVLGGRASPGPPNVFNNFPELYSPSSGWQTLTGAPSVAAYGQQNFYYPQAWLAPNGQVYILGHNGSQYFLDPAGLGKLAPVAGASLPQAGNWLPSVMYLPGKVLSLRLQAQSIVVDLNAGKPVATSGGNLSQDRLMSNATLLADGRVVVTGGSAVNNELTQVAYQTEIWDPALNRWTTGASAAKPRLYHSVAMLLPDATLVVGGGGAPGPVKNLNAEIFYPPYLFKQDGSGNFADRPAVTTSPAAVAWNQSFTVGVSAGTKVSRVTWVHTGTVTHNFNSGQRFQELPFTQSGSTIKLTSPDSPNIAPPGYYMLFVFDANGVPSVAKIIRMASSS